VYRGLLTFEGKDNNSQVNQLNREQQQVDIGRDSTEFLFRNFKCYILWHFWKCFWKVSLKDRKTLTMFFALPGVPRKWQKFEC